jgi:hypothetical protein
MTATRMTGRAVWVAAWLGWASVPGCFDAHHSYGGETHFMRGCEERCGGGLTCVCGVCTQPCLENAACDGLAGQASCAAVNVDREVCGDELASLPARACVASCGRDADCAALGAGFACDAGQCRERAAAGEPPVFVTIPERCAGADCTVAAQRASEQPLVMFLVDTSGSMERKAACPCETPACEECLPDCDRGERSRWIELLEALGGTFEGYGCERIERTAENGASYDAGYYLPHIAARGVQGDDGVLDVYRDRVRFGLATFDGWDTYVDALPLVPLESFDFEKSGGTDGQWSYNPTRALGRFVLGDRGRLAGSLRYPGCDVDYYMDTGIRSPNATEGALIGAVETERALEVNAQIQAELRRTRPYGGTPMAAALDDLFHYMGEDRQMAVERERAAAKHVVLITDGYPDADYRDVGCNCDVEGDPANPYRCGPDPTHDRYNPQLMHCPYPTVATAARTLRCGKDDHACNGPVERVHVVAYAVDDPMVVDQLDLVAVGGGTTGVVRASHRDDLRSKLLARLAEIAP